jgi:hypothetical protein
VCLAAHILSLVYSNSLLATLNSRSRIRDALNEPISLELPHWSLSPHTSGKNGSASDYVASPLSPLSFAKRADIGEPPEQSVSQFHNVYIHHVPNRELHTRDVYTR